MAAEEPDNSAERTAETDALWADVRVEPVRVALPAGVGYTLRAYRDSDELPEFVGATSEDDEDDETALVTRVGEADPGTAGRTLSRDDRSDRSSTADDETAELDPDFDAETDDSDETDETDDETDATGEAAEPTAVPVEEVPVFLSHRGRVLLFRSPEGLAAFVRDDGETDLAAIDTWSKLTKSISADDVVPTDDDDYELDLVVENLRGGHDAWDPELIVSAGEFTRDLAYALRLAPVINAVSAGSPLDDLDDGLRAVADGGIGAFRARRRVRKIGAQQAALAWRTIIGKISAAVDWRD